MNRFILLVVFVLTVSCADGLQQALEFAGDNRGELEKVLEHYAASGDEEKLQAAEWLITNMPGHKSMIGDYSTYYDAVDSLFEFSESPDIAFRKLPELSSGYDDRISYEFDSRVIRADFLIRNIDLAFAQWREGEWAQHIDFEEFCEWLLPYTCGQSEPMDEWRVDLEPIAKSYIDKLNECDDYKGCPRAAICRVNDKLKGMIVKQKWHHDSFGHNIYRPSTFALLPGASCEDYSEMAVRIMRSKGIPVGVDYTPQWPDRYYGHYWCIFPNLRGKTTMFNPYASNPDYPHYSHCKFAKVFRRTYAQNKECMALLKKYQGDVPPLCRTPFFKDVTDEYMQTVDIEVPLIKGTGYSRRDVYIAVFDNFDWKPVYWGKKCCGRAFFKGMGKNITYMVVGYENGEQIPLSKPFHLDFDGNINEFTPNFRDTESFEICRKYPMFQHVFVIHKSLHGGYIEASDDPLFSKSEIVSELPEWSLTSGKVIVRQTKPHRYWRLCAEDGRKCDMAELFFVGVDGNFIRPIIGNSLVDGDPLTNYSPNENKLLEIIDLGEPVTLKEIMYVRRGDGNAIIPGDEYEIYYWHDSSWKFHTSITADDVCLRVSDLPSGALYYIKGISRGVQNRIFVWDDEKKTIIWH